MLQEIITAAPVWSPENRQILAQTVIEIMRYLKFSVFIVLMILASGCIPLDDGSLFKSLGVGNSSVEEQDDGSYIGMDGVVINEYTKNGMVVRVFCNKDTGLIKVKSGDEAKKIKNLDSPENIREAMKMPESDYLRLGGGFMESVMTIGVSKKGHAIIMSGLGLYIAGSEDTEDVLAEALKQNEIDFVYMPCSFKMAEENQDSIFERDADSGGVKTAINGASEYVDRVWSLQSMLVEKKLQDDKKRFELEQDVWWDSEASDSVDTKAATRSDDERIEQVLNHKKQSGRSKRSQDHKSFVGVFSGKKVNSHDSDHTGSSTQSKSKKSLRDLGIISNHKKKSGRSNEKSTGDERPKDTDYGIPF